MKTTNPLAIGFDQEGNLVEHRDEPEAPTSSGVVDREVGSRVTIQTGPKNRTIQFDATEQAVEQSNLNELHRRAKVAQDHLDACFMYDPDTGAKVLRPGHGELHRVRKLEADRLRRAVHHQFSTENKRLENQGNTDAERLAYDLELSERAIAGDPAAKAILRKRMGMG